MKWLLRCVLFLGLAAAATPSEAVVHLLVNKVVECPVVRKMRQVPPKKAAHKMKARQPLFGGCSKCDDDECDCNRQGSNTQCECDCGCN